MKIKKFSMDAKNTKISYVDDSISNANDVVTLKSDATPRPELIKAYNKLADVMRINFPLIVDAFTEIMISAVNFNYDKDTDEVDGIILECLCGTRDVNNCSTHLKVVTTELEITKHRITLQTLMDEISLFARGRRAQMSLFEQENSEPADKGVTFSLKTTESA